MILNYSLPALGVFRRFMPGFKTLAVAICAAVLAVPTSAQLHIQQPQMPTPVLPATPVEMHGWPDALTPDLIALLSTSSPAERKLSFNLFLITRKQRKAPIAAFASLMDTRAMNPDGSVNVEIIAYLSPSLMASSSSVWSKFRGHCTCSAAARNTRRRMAGCSARRRSTSIAIEASSGWVELARPPPRTALPGSSIEGKIRANSICQ